MRVARQPIVWTCVLISTVEYSRQPHLAPAHPIRAMYQKVTNLPGISLPLPSDDSDNLSTFDDLGDGTTESSQYGLFVLEL